MMSLVKEAIDTVVPLVQTELPSLVAVTALQGKKIWFNAKQAVGCLPVTRSQEASGFNSCIKIMNCEQEVTEIADQVRSIIRGGGGTPL